MRALLSALQIAPGVSESVAVVRAEELSARAEAFNTIARAAGMPYQPSDVKRSTEEILAGMEGRGTLTRALKDALNQVGEAAGVSDGASVADVADAVRGMAGRLDQAARAQGTDRYAVICAVLGVPENAPLADTVRIVAAGRA